MNKAVELYKSLKAAYCEDKDMPEIVLVHSRFRGAEREKILEKIKEKNIPEAGRIIISTQVVEAGVDISSAMLLTELAPWPSMVQRIGRCNRYAECEEAKVYWIDLKDKENDYSPYDDEKDEMEQSREILSEYGNKSLSPLLLHGVDYNSKPNYRFVIRKKDIKELFDNTPDLTGYDIDVSRFIRDTVELDLQVFWRDFPQDPASIPDMPLPSREELCPVPFYEFRDWLKSLNQNKMNAYVWDQLEGKWVCAEKEMLWPGTLVLLPREAGGYNPELGWYPTSNEDVTDISLNLKAGIFPESMSYDMSAESAWVDLITHSRNVQKMLNQIFEELLSNFQSKKDHVVSCHDLRDILSVAALLHDAGKASTLFQQAFVSIPEDKKNVLLAKGKMKAGSSPYERKYFRHELVSTLLLLQNKEVLGALSASELNFSLIAYLVAAHHGKVRCGIRALPFEKAPDDGRRFALGVWEGDVVDEMEIGEYRFPRTELSLRYMELGYGDVGEQSWMQRCAALLDQLGPFRLAYLEALVRCADVRISKEERF